MSDDFTPETEAAGDLTQPPRKPPTAVGLATPAPAPEQRRLAHSRSWLEKMINRTFDTVDDIGDTIAAALGLRSR